MYLSNLFTDHCVLQRSTSIPVWGWVKKPKMKITGTMNGITVYGISGDDCKFLLRFPPQQAGGPYVLDVSTLNGEEKVSVKDVLIGDLWLASGQSNMGMNLASCDDDECIDNARTDEIRMIKVDNRADLAPQETFSGEWQLSTPENKGQFSAVAFHFGQRLQDETSVPVGIINSSWGGTFIETWISRDRLLQNRHTKAWVERYELDSYSKDHWELLKGSEYPSDPGSGALADGWAEVEFDDSEWDTIVLPRSWQIEGHRYSGVFWFRKRIVLPETAIGKDLELCLGGIDKHDIAYVNGVEVGRTGSGFEQEHWNHDRSYRVPGEVIQDQVCEIAVRVYSFVYDGGFSGSADTMRLVLDDEQVIPTAGEWKYRCEHNLGFVNIPAVMGHNYPNSPYMCYENMIKVLLPAAIKGVIWYQGESNAGESACVYGQLMKDLIADWRYRFANDKLPFLQVQLANYMQADDYQEVSTWAVLRDQQRRVLETANTGMAVTIDVGEEDDIHPKDKKTVGRRLAQWALANCYGRDIIPGSPLYSHMLIEGEAIRVYFDNAGSGLKTSDGKAVNAVYICDRSKVFKRAEAVIDGNALVVSSPEIKTPLAVRYAWANNPDGANLINQIGFPASPFTTES